MRVTPHLSECLATPLRYALLIICLAAASFGQDVQQILKGLEEISGLRALKPVPQETITRANLRKFFEGRMKKAVDPEELRMQETVLKKLGLVPQDFALAKTMIDLLSEQAAAFYDYEKGRMVMLEGGAGAMEQMALVHELAHALADQHFQIKKFLAVVKDEDEAALARQAVLEGQAQWLMSEYLARQMGQSLLKSPALANMLLGATQASGETGGGPYPVYNQAPLYLRESLVFPYAAGMAFQQAVAARDGKDAFPRVFQKPPANSHEVMHPEVYLDGNEPRVARIEAPAPGDGKKWKMIAEGTLGEFDYSILLKLYAPDSQTLAAEWRGGRFRLWEQKQSGVAKQSLTLVSQWSSPEVAQRYLAAYRRILAGKWPDARFDTDREDLLTGFGGGGWFEVRLDGAAVVSREGLFESTLKP